MTSDFQMKSSMLHSYKHFFQIISYTFMWSKTKLNVFRKSIYFTTNTIFITPEHTGVKYVTFRFRVFKGH